MLDCRFDPMETRKCWKPLKKVARELRYAWHVFMYVCVCVRVCMCVCARMCVCTCICMLCLRACVSFVTSNADSVVMHGAWLLFIVLTLLV